MEDKIHLFKDEFTTMCNSTTMYIVMTKEIYKTTCVKCAWREVNNIENKIDDFNSMARGLGWNLNKAKKALQRLEKEEVK